jgi:hypothetical protein
MCAALDPLAPPAPPMLAVETNASGRAGELLGPDAGAIAGDACNDRLDGLRGTLGDVGLRSGFHGLDGLLTGLLAPLPPEPSAATSGPVPTVASDPRRRLLRLLPVCVGGTGNARPVSPDDGTESSMEDVDVDAASGGGR